MADNGTANAPVIPDMMKAVVCYAPGDYRMESLPVPKQLESGEVLIKVLAAGICAGDAKCYAGAPLFWGDDSRKAYCEPPITPGHEFVGEVVALGEGSVEKYGLQIGDHCISEQIVPCWECRYCKRGSFHMCMPHDIYGFHQKTPGAMAEYMKFPAGAINFKVPKTIPPWKAAFIEPLACSIHGVERGDIQFNHVVVVSGCGPLGLGMVAAAKQKNPAKLIALDMFDWKLDIARKCGADLTFNPGKCNVVKEVQKITDGYGCDVYIEISGNPVSVKQGLLMICKLGTFVEFSVFGRETTVDWTIIGDTKELNIRGGHCGPNCYPKAIDMIAKDQLPMEDIITHQFPLEDVVKGIDLVNKGTESIKVVLFP